MLRIDDATYNIPILSLKRTADFLDKYANRTEDGVLHRELIGVYFNYQLELGAITDPDEYARLWDKLTEPKEFHTVIVPNESGSYTFQAYFSNVADQMRTRHNGKNYFEGLTVNFIAQKPAREA